jgi:hypothetical protein
MTSDWFQADKSLGITQTKERMTATIWVQIVHGDHGHKGSRRTRSRHRQERNQRHARLVTLHGQNPNRRRRGQNIENRVITNLGHRRPLLVNRVSQVRLKI